MNTVHFHIGVVKLKKQSKIENLWEGNQSVRFIVWIYYNHLPFCFSLQFAIPQDTPELAAFLYNSTISHYIRRREVAVAEPYRRNSAKILVSWLKSVDWDYTGSAVSVAVGLTAVHLQAPKKYLMFKMKIFMWSNRSDIQILGSIFGPATEYFIYMER